MDDRKEFLLRMYNELWNNINRHILTPWQSAIVLLAVFGGIAKIEQYPDLVTTIIILTGAWQLAHVIDSSHWVNRNLLIIANIERQFLFKDDTKNIHLYFGTHRKWSMFNTFRIQLCLGIGIMALFLLYHFSTRVLPGIGGRLSGFELMRSLPYIAVVASIYWLVHFYEDTRAKYKGLNEKSPGSNSFCTE
jgi:hypothetical protein